MSSDQLAPSRLNFSRRDVALLRWPAQEDVRDVLAAADLPRLLLISRDCPAPACIDALEDWLREPLDPDELELRAARLQRRARLRAFRPQVDANGLVRAGDRWVGLPPVQQPVAELLISRFGRVVSGEQIRAAYLDAGGSMHPKAVKAMISRVKRRLSELDLVLTTVRDRGYLLEGASDSGDCS